MSYTAPLPKREAKVQFSTALNAPWNDVLDIDPIMLPVDQAGMADVFDGKLLDLLDAIAEHDDLGQIHTLDRLVWSDDETPVRGVCPHCDDVFVVADGYPDDLPGEDVGQTAVVCGCQDD